MSAAQQPAPQEIPVSFSGSAGTVHAVLHRPAAEAGNGTAVLFLHGWSGDRTGPHRMFVKLARSLAEIGYLSLRVDFCGRGDSDGDTASASIESMVADAGRAVAFLREQPQCRQVVLLGICSGGKVAIATAALHPGTPGLILWSAEPMGHLRSTAAGRNKARYALGQYLRKLTKAETWRKIFTLSVNVRQVNKTLFRPEMRSADEARQEDKWLDRFRTFSGKVLFVYGTNDPETRMASQNYRAFCERYGIPHEFQPIEGANHSFYSLAWERQVMAATTAWLTRQ